MTIYEKWYVHKHVKSVIIPAPKVLSCKYWEWFHGFTQQRNTTCEMKYV